MSYNGGVDERDHFHNWQGMGCDKAPVVKLTLLDRLLKFILQLMGDKN